MGERIFKGRYYARRLRLGRGSRDAYSLNRYLAANNAKGANLYFN